MQYIAALDYGHLNNEIFLTTLARSVSQQKNVRPIIIHTDSSYTERIIQTGVMREQAQIRSHKELNRRLVGVFADQGVSAIGLNGHQHKLVTLDDDHLKLNESFFQTLPSESVLIISCLAWSNEPSRAVSVPLTEFVLFLQNRLTIESVFAFSASDETKNLTDNQPSPLSWKNLPDGFEEQYLPHEFEQFDHPLYLAAAHNFRPSSEEKKAIFIKN